MDKHVKFEESNVNEITPENRLLPGRSVGHGLGGCEKTTDSRIKRSPRHMKDPKVATIHIPTTLAEAPFLQHARLTPGQKRYLSTIAGVHSAEHVWKLLQQHYMNIAHRCIRTGLDSVTDFSTISESLEPTPSLSQASVAETETLPKIVDKPGQKHLKKVKNSLPKIDNRRKRTAAKNVHSKKGATRKSTVSGDQTNISTTKGASLSKPDDTDDDDSLDELIKALSMEDDEDRFL
ncbi:protein FAM216A [Sardina pilchardus]|uniref:protein FAM216A n=1 Tax=Sardina pilchardus TaxID=27697 RepID=UPI002E14F8EB